MRDPDVFLLLPPLLLLIAMRAFYELSLWITSVFAFTYPDLHHGLLGILRLRNSRNGVLCAVAMTEGLDLRDDDARFCIFAKIPWPDLTDPYTQERLRRSEDWYRNRTALAVVQGSGRVVRNETDQADTFIFDSSLEMVLYYCPDWWTAALRSGKPPRSVTVNDDRDGTVD